MRAIAVAILFLLCACDDDGAREGACVHDGTPHALGEVFPAGDGCNSCTCTSSGVACTAVACSDAGVDANPMSCAAFGGCPEGPACGAICCSSGERCVNGACRCGITAGCGSGDTCEAAGPTGGDRCGVVCCGRTGPCPQ